MKKTMREFGELWEWVWLVYPPPDDEPVDNIIRDAIKLLTIIVPLVIFLTWAIVSYR